jgi:hypothetical protein
MNSGLSPRPPLRSGFPPSFRRCRLRHIGELHGRPPVPNFDQIGDANIEHLGQVVQHLQTRIANAAFDLLKIAVREPVRRNVLLGEPASPTGSAEVPTDPTQEGGEVHPQTMAGACRIIEPIRLACYSLTRSARGRRIESSACRAGRDTEG